MTNKPLSEIDAKFHPEWTAADCIAELQRIANAEPDRFITRMYFRNVSRISDATWSRYYGTFAEFKAQAGITLSRFAHNIEKQVAKHASATDARRLDEQRLGWGDRFERPSSKRFQTVLLMTDGHDLQMDRFYRRVVLDVAARLQPDRVVNLGDAFDCPDFGKYANDPREFKLIERIRYVHQFFRELRAAAPNAVHDLHEGNHERRLVTLLANATPAMMVLLADLHGMDVPGLLGLRDFEINYIAHGGLAAWTKSEQTADLRHNHKVYYETFIGSHYNTLRNKGLSGFSGHHHRFESWNSYHPVSGPTTWLQLGCGHKRLASYTNGQPWQNGFAIAYVDTHKRYLQTEYCDVTGAAACIGGKWYDRSAEETLVIGTF